MSFQSTVAQSLGSSACLVSRRFWDFHLLSGPLPDTRLVNPVAVSVPGWVIGILSASGPSEPQLLAACCCLHSLPISVTGASTLVPGAQFGGYHDASPPYLKCQQILLAVRMHPLPNHVSVRPPCHLVQATTVLPVSLQQLPNWLP